jgi:hypothetical protein
MKRHKVRVVLLILLTLVGCAQMAAAPVQAPNASYPLDDNGIRPEHGGGDGGGSGM